MGNQKITRWSAVSAGHIMMGAALQDGPISSGIAGSQLKIERLSALLSLNKVARHFRRGVSRQAICQIEAKPIVSPETAAEFRRAIRAACKGDRFKLCGRQ